MKGMSHIDLLHFLCGSAMGIKLNKKLTFMTFWAINDALCIDRLKTQLYEMKELGFDGTVFQPRNYPNKPTYLSEEYFEILSDLILYAKALNMEFWIYDENGWPSGTANGEVLKLFPDCTCEWVTMTENGLQFFERREINTFHKEALDSFIKLTYDGYRKGLHTEAFDYVTGFFSDEVGFLNGHGALREGGVPWHNEVESRFMKQYNMSAKSNLSLLFTKEEGYQEFRCRYWQILTDLLGDNFYSPIEEWCDRYKKRYTAHLKGEENIFFQIPCSGSAYENLRRINTPAIDALERYPGNHYYPHIVSSLSRQFSDGRCLVEAIGGSGWGLSPQTLSSYVDWLAEAGLDTFVFHLSQYTLNSEAIRDWPPSMPFGLTWKNSFRQVLDSLKERWKEQSYSSYKDYLIVAPVRGVMSDFQPEEGMLLNEHDGSGVPDSPGGKISKAFSRLIEQCYQNKIDYDVTEERLLERYGKITEKGISVGNMTYGHVVLGNHCIFEDTEFEDALNQSGIIEVLPFTGEKWRVKAAGKNQIFLQWHTDKNNKSSWSIPVRINDTQWKENILKGMGVLIHDRVNGLTVNGIKIACTKQTDGYWYEFDAKVCYDIMTVKSINIEMVSDTGEFIFGFLQGYFLVKNTHPYFELRNSQWSVDDGFYLTAICEKDGFLDIDAHNLIEEGFPFMFHPVTVEGEIAAEATGCIDLSPVYADAAYVRIDNNAYGYIWGSEWKLQNVEPGVHKISLDLIPSTFNTYGPHHHYEGDRYLTSPIQYTGNKNFADGPDAPEHTAVLQWHFVKFGID